MVHVRFVAQMHPLKRKKEEMYHRVTSPTSKGKWVRARNHIAACRQCRDEQKMFENAGRVVMHPSVHLLYFHSILYLKSNLFVYFVIYLTN